MTGSCRLCPSNIERRQIAELIAKESHSRYLIAKARIAELEAERDALRTQLALVPVMVECSDGAH